MLNSNVTNVKTYVGADGKLHFVNSAGADTALNFSSGGDSDLVLGIVDITNYINARGGYVIYGAITTGKEYDLSKYKFIQLIFQHYNYYDETWGVGFTKIPNDTLDNCQNTTKKQTYSHVGNHQDSFITKSIYLDISEINEKGYPFVYRVGSVYSYVIKLQLVNELEVL